MRCYNRKRRLLFLYNTAFRRIE